MRCFLVLCSLLYFTSVSHAFVRSVTNEEQLPISWPDTCIPYFISDAGSTDISLNDLIPAIRQSFEVWQEPACSGQKFVYGGLTPVTAVGYVNGGVNTNVVVFRETAAEWGYSRFVIALTTVVYCKKAAGQCRYVGQILDADIELNGAHVNFSVSSPPASGRFDVQNSLAHEVGHFLGFDHNCREDEGACSPTGRQATMYESAPAEETQKRDLSDDDIEGLCTVYPAGDDEINCAESIGEGLILGDGGVYTVERPGPSSEGCAVLFAEAAPSTLPLGMLLLGLWGMRRRRTRP
jgi:hypothetical protein